jgi:hypothetical protein
MTIGILFSLALGTMAYPIEKCLSESEIPKEKFRCLASVNRRQCKMNEVYTFKYKVKVGSVEQEKTGSYSGIEECFEYFDCPEMKSRYEEISSLFSKYGKSKDIRKVRRLIGNLVAIIESESRSQTIQDIHRVRCLLDRIMSIDYGIIDLIEEKWIHDKISDEPLLVWLTEAQDKVTVKIQRALEADYTSRYSLRRILLVVSAACIIYLMTIVFANRIIKTHSMLIIFALVLLGAFFIIM